MFIDLLCFVKCSILVTAVLWKIVVIIMTVKGMRAFNNVRMDGSTSNMDNGVKLGKSCC